MDQSNAGQHTSSVYSGNDSQYAPASEYSSVTNPPYTPSTYYNASNTVATPGQTASSSQYSYQHDNAPTTPPQYGTTRTAATAGHTTLTSQELRRHDAQLHSDHRHARSGRRSHHRRSHVISGTANAALPQQQRRDQVTHNHAGMAPSEHPQANTPHYHTTTPQPYYTPSSSATHTSSSNPHNNESYSHTQYTSPSSVTSTGYNQPQDATYWTQYTPSPTQGKDLVDWGYDLAGVGTQFNSNGAQQAYASYSNDEEE